MFTTFAHRMRMRMRRGVTRYKNLEEAFTKRLSICKITTLLNLRQYILHCQRNRPCVRKSRAMYIAYAVRLQLSVSSAPQCWSKAVLRTPT